MEIFVSLKMILNNVLKYMFFCVSDIKVNISMKFSGKNDLELYSIDEQGNRIYIIEMNDNNGGYGTISRTIYINASSNVSNCMISY